MRMGIGGYLVAVNTFATQRMGLELYQRALLSGDAVLKLGRGESAFAGFMEGARQRNWEIVPIHFLFPGIMGKVTDDAHGWAKETFLKTLRAAGPLDGLFLQMHGTAASDSGERREPATCSRQSASWSDPGFPIIVSLDGHANVTPKMVQHATMLIGVRDQSSLRLRADRAARGALVIAGMADGGDVAGQRLGAAGDGPSVAETLHRARLADGASDAAGTQSRHKPPAHTRRLCSLCGFFLFRSAAKPASVWSSRPTASRTSRAMSPKKSRTRAGPGATRFTPRWFRSKRPVR